MSLRNHTGTPMALAVTVTALGTQAPVARVKNQAGASPVTLNGYSYSARARRRTNKFGI